MFCLCFTEHTKAHAFCLWPYMQKNHICFKHTLQLNCCKPIGMKMKINQVSLKVLWGKSQTVGCWWWRPSIWLSVCEITYFVPLGSTSIHAVLSHNSSDLSLCPLKNREITSIHTHTHTWRAIVFRFCQSTLNAHRTAGFFRETCMTIYIKTVSLFWWLHSKTQWHFLFSFPCHSIIHCPFASLFCLLF